MEGLCVWDLLVKLDADTVGELLTTWLELKDVGTLDSAFCNKNARRLFLSTLSAVVTPFISGGCKSSEDFALWLSKRGVRSDFLKIVDSAVSVSLSCAGHHTNVQLYGFECKPAELVTALVLLAKKCPGVVEIDLGNVCVEENVLQILLGAFAKLRTLRCGRVTPDCFPLLLTGSCKLTGLHFSSDRLCMQKFAHAGVLKRLSDVTFGQAIVWTGNSDLREDMSLQLPTQYTTLLRATFHWIQVSDLVIVMKHAPSLRHLEVTAVAMELDGPGLFSTAAHSVPMLECFRIQQLERVIPHSSRDAWVVEQAAVDMVLQLRCLQELTLGGHSVQHSEVDRTYDLSKGAANTSMRVLKLGRVFHYDCIGALMQISPSLKVVSIEQRLRPVAREALRGMQLNRLCCAAIRLQYKDVAHLRCLTRLELHCLRPQKDKELTAEELESLLQSNRNLTHLQLHFHDPVSKGQILMMVARSCPHLRRLHVHADRELGTRGVGDQNPVESGVQEVLRACPGLAEVDLGYGLVRFRK